jgi:hypothetical protein
MFFLLSINAFSQTIYLSGSVFDKDTQVPVSAVSIHTKDNKIGTISTVKGKFSLDILNYKANDYLYFTSIEYETDSLLISKAQNPINIQLTPKIYTLKDVYVMPDSTLLVLLRKAYQKISDNYPDQPTRYESFFQHSVFNEKDSLIELIESILSVYKESYCQKKEMPGQIEILRSRRKQLQNSIVGFIGGAFAPVNSDIVLQRMHYIHPDYFSHYHYDFTGIITLNGKDCYKIEFYPLGKDCAKVQGNLLIDVESLAYVVFEMHSEYPENVKNILGLMKPIKSSTKINYGCLNGRWYLKQVTENNFYENIRLDHPLSSVLNYVTISVQTDSVKPIPVEKRLEYMEPIEAKTEIYKPDGWTDSDILVNENLNQLYFQFSTDEAASIFQQNVNTAEKFSLRKTFIQIVPKIIMGYGIRYGMNQKAVLFQGVLGYRLNKRWSIGWQTVEDFYYRNMDWKENNLGFTFRKNLNNAGYPFFLETSLWISDRSFKRGNYKSKTQFILPQISLSKRMGQFTSLEFIVNYPIPVHSTKDPNDFDYYPQMGIVFYIF